MPRETMGALSLLTPDKVRRAWIDLSAAASPLIILEYMRQISWGLWAMRHSRPAVTART